MYYHVLNDAMNELKWNVIDFSDREALNSTGGLSRNEHSEKMLRLNTLSLQ